MPSASSGGWRGRPRRAGRAPHRVAAGMNRSPSVDQYAPSPRTASGQGAALRPPRGRWGGTGRTPCRGALRLRGRRSRCRRRGRRVGSSCEQTARLLLRSPPASSGPEPAAARRGRGAVRPSSPPRLRSARRPPCARAPGCPGDPPPGGSASPRSPHPWLPRRRGGSVAGRGRPRDPARSCRPARGRTRRPCGPGRGIRSMPSVTSTRTASGSQSPRPAVTVSARCCSGSSPGPMAAATPPCAMNEFDARSEPFVTSVTSAPRSAAASAA